MVKRFSRTPAIAVTLAVVGWFPAAIRAQKPALSNGVYTEAQAGRGRTLYKTQCAECHGASLAGGLAPPLSGTSFTEAWMGRSLGELANKIRNTMPADDPGKLTRQQSADLVAQILQSDKFPAGRNELPADEKALAAIVLPGKPATVPPAASVRAFPPAGNLAQVMRGILFPSSNMIFNVQTSDPGAPVPKAAGGQGATTGTAFSWVDWGAGIYKGWEIVDYAAIAVAESAPLMLTPGRRCENGRPVPVDRPDWIKFTQELADAGRAAYKASQTRSQEAVSDASNQLADSCLHCHEVYRDKRGGTTADPSNKAARCVP